MLKLKDRIFKKKKSGKFKPAERPAETSEVVKPKRPAISFACSENPKWSITTMWSLGDGRIYVTCCVSDYTYDTTNLFLFDANGLILQRVDDVGCSHGIFPIAGGRALLSWQFRKNVISLIHPDGKKTTHDLEYLFDNIVYSLSNDTYYLRKLPENTLYLASFSLNKDQLTLSLGDTFFTETEEVGALKDVSPDGRYYLFLESVKQVVVYTRSEEGTCNLVASYTQVREFPCKVLLPWEKLERDRIRERETFPIGACFCLLDGVERVLVTIYDDNYIHVIDHLDGGRFLGYLDTGGETLDTPSGLVTDYYNYLWISCKGGRVVKLALNPDLKALEGASAQSKEGEGISSSAP